MAGGHPRLFETLLGYLIPPACREEVLGDLHERHSDTGTWLFEAMRTIPRVIESRIRRTSDPLVLLMNGVVMYSSWMAAALYRESGFLSTPLAFLRMALPPAVVLLALASADAYANPAKRWPQRPVMSAMLSFLVAFLSQVALRTGNPELALPRTLLLYGGAFALPLVCALRMLYTPLPDLPLGAAGPAHWMKEDPVGMPPIFWQFTRIAALIMGLAIAGEWLGLPPRLVPRAVLMALVGFVMYNFATRR